MLGQHTNWDEWLNSNILSQLALMQMSIYYVVDNNIYIVAFEIESFA